MTSIAARLLLNGTFVFAFMLPMHPAAADVISADAFGMHFHGMANGGEWPPGAEFGYVRLWDARVLWRDLEPVKGQWKFELLDRYVDEANKRGVKVLLTLGQPPQWAALRPDTHSPYGDGASSEPRNIDDWRNYVTTLARRYKGRIHAWEVWNEINVKHFWIGDFQKLVELEKITVEAVKTVDPAAVVLSASIQGGAFRELDAYIKMGGGSHADAISYHFYAPTEEPEALPERIARVREIMGRYGLGSKPLWNTEFGWLIPNKDGGMGKNPRPIWKRWRKTERLEAAGFVLRAYLLAMNGGIRHNFWYAWDNGAMGLAEDKGMTPKPAAKGYIRAREWLIGADFMGCASASGVWRCMLRRDGRPQWIVWSDEERAFDPPSDWKPLTVQGLFDIAPVPYEGAMRVGPLPSLVSR
jgi:hypothetical protein